MYRIEQGTYNKAKQLGVEVRPSHRKDKKIDVIKNDKVIASVGALGMKDYWKYLAEDGQKVANQRRALYKMRHEKDRHIYMSNGWWADALLW
jgi:hypothetical protein